MNKYLLKLAGKLPPSVKHWVRERLKVDTQGIERLNRSSKITAADRLGRKEIYRGLAKVDRVTSRIAKNEGAMEDHYYDRGGAIVHRVLGSRLKGK